MAGLIVAKAAARKTSAAGRKPAAASDQAASPSLPEPQGSGEAPAAASATAGGAASAAPTNTEGGAGADPKLLEASAGDRPSNPAGPAGEAPAGTFSRAADAPAPNAGPEARAADAGGSETTDEAPATNLNGELTFGDILARTAKGDGTYNGAAALAMISEALLPGRGLSEAEVFEAFMAAKAMTTEAVSDGEVTAAPAGLDDIGWTDQAPTIRIVSKVDGFRRAGVAHPTAATDHPHDRFTPDDLRRLVGEPNLDVRAALPNGDVVPLVLDNGRIMLRPK